MIFRRQTSGHPSFAGRIQRVASKIKWLTSIISLITFLLFLDRKILTQDDVANGMLAAESKIWKPNSDERARTITSEFPRIFETTGNPARNLRDRNPYLDGALDRDAKDSVAGKSENATISTSSPDSNNSDDKLYNTSEPDMPNPDSGTSYSSKPDLYEFIAFVCWYLFLVMCCIIPTMCVYRQRLIRERQVLQELEDSMAQRARRVDQNYFTSFRNRERRHGEEWRKKCEGLLQNGWKYSKMIIKEDDYVPRNVMSKYRDEESLGFLPVSLDVDNSVKCGEAITVNDENDESEINAYGTSTGSMSDKDSHSDVDSDNTGTNCTVGKRTESARVAQSQLPLCSYSDDVFDDDDGITPSHVILPTSKDTTTQSGECGNGEPRTVPNSCAICLCPYDIGDAVVWSSNVSCQHAFHEGCMMAWCTLKLGEEWNSKSCLCPSCRQDFVTLECAPSELDSHDQEEQGDSGDRDHAQRDNGYAALSSTSFSFPVEFLLSM